jgi:hypothetical protein
MLTEATTREQYQDTLKFILSAEGVDAVECVRRSDGQKVTVLTVCFESPAGVGHIPVAELIAPLAYNERGEIKTMDLTDRYYPVEEGFNVTSRKIEEERAAAEAFLAAARLVDAEDERFDGVLDQIIDDTDEYDCGDPECALCHPTGADPRNPGGELPDNYGKQEDYETADFDGDTLHVEAGFYSGAAIFGTYPGGAKTQSTAVAVERPEALKLVAWLIDWFKFGPSEVADATVPRLTAGLAELESELELAR